MAAMALLPLLAGTAATAADADTDAVGAGAGALLGVMLVIRIEETAEPVMEAAVCANVTGSARRSSSTSAAASAACCVLIAATMAPTDDEDVSRAEKRTRIAPDERRRLKCSGGCPCCSRRAKSGTASFR
jgi:hypothetical protein